jgi:hypothetical protein
MTLYLHTNFHKTQSDESLVINIKPKGEYRIHEVSITSFHILQGNFIKRNGIVF